MSKVSSKDTKFETKDSKLSEEQIDAKKKAVKEGWSKASFINWYFTYNWCNEAIDLLRNDVKLKLEDFGDFSSKMDDYSIPL